MYVAEYSILLILTTVMYARPLGRRQTVILDIHINQSRLYKSARSESSVDNVWIYKTIALSLTCVLQLSIQCLSLANDRATVPPSDMHTIRNRKGMDLCNSQTTFFRNRYQPLPF